MQFRKGKSIGSSMMVLQEQMNHQNKLEHIYTARRPRNSNDNSSYKYSYLHTNYSKKQRYDDQMHLKTIQKLVYSLNKGKTMADRLKDPHDFFAYPTLFFRETSKKSMKKTVNKEKHLKKVKSQASFNRDSTQISKEQIRQFLPILTQFQQSDFEEFTDGINKLIISFNIVTKKQLQKLQQMVMNFLPKSCPDDFKSAIQMMFNEIEQQMVQ